MTSSDRQLLEREMREAFEAWAVGPTGTGRPWRCTEPGFTHQYEDSHTELAWRAWTASRQKALQEAEKLRAALINIEEACVYSPHREIGTWDASLAQLIHHHVQFLQAASAIRSLGGITSNEGERG